MKGSGAKGFSRPRPNRTVLPSDEDRTSTLYTEGIEQAWYTASDVFNGNEGVNFPSPDPSLYSSSVDFGRPVAVRTAVHCRVLSEFQWSHDNVRWYDLPGLYRWFWPHYYSDSNAMMIHHGRKLFARYWRVKTVDPDFNDPPYTEVYRWGYQEIRDPQIIYDHNDYDGYDKIGNDQNWALNSQVYHEPNGFNNGYYMHLGCRPDQAFSLMDLHDYSGAFRHHCYNQGYIQRGQSITTGLRSKYQITQLRKQGVTFGTCPWGDGSAYEDEQQWHTNSFFWNGNSLEENQYVYYAFKHCPQAGIACVILPAGTTSVKHHLGQVPDLVMAGSTGTDIYSDNGIGNFVMMSSEPTFVYEDWRNDEVTRASYGADVDAERIYYPEWENSGRWALCAVNRTDKKINIACGSYIGDGISGKEINVGFEPYFTQFLVPESANPGLDDIPTFVGNTSTSEWYRGKWDNDNNGDYAGLYTALSTGFRLDTTGPKLNNAGEKYLYICLGGHPFVNTV